MQAGSRRSSSQYPGPARGRLGGRPKALDPRKVQIAQQLYHDKTNAIADICRTLRISRATLYRYVKTGTGEPT